VFADENNFEGGFRLVFYISRPPSLNPQIQPESDHNNAVFGSGVVRMEILGSYGKVREGRDAGSSIHH
jgi:hypothetical protein